MNYQNENENGTSFNTVCTFLSCFDSHKYSMKKRLPGKRKHAQDFEQEECEGNGNIGIFQGSMCFFCFESLGFLLQLKGHPNDYQKNEGCGRCKTLAEFGLQQDAKLSTATGDTSLSAAGFPFQVSVHPTLEGGTGTSALPSGETFPPECKPFLGCQSRFRLSLFPTPTLQRAAESQEHPGHIAQQ